MRIKRKLSLSFFLLMSVSLFSSSSAQGRPVALDYRVDQIPLPIQPPENVAIGKLNGNWKLAGDRDQKIYPMLSVNLAVDGSWIIGAASYDIVCSNRIHGHFSSDNNTIIGKVASDGGFTLSLGSLASDGRFISQVTPSDQVVVTVNGVVPSGDANSWKGTYTFTIPPYKPLSSNPLGACISPQHGSFVARPYAPLSGTYTGVISGHDFGSNVAVTINVSQSGPQPRPSLDGRPQLTPFPLFPLSATISVKGSPCFTHGTSTAPINGNKISGNLFDLNFDMDGVAVLLLDGWVSGADSDTLRDVNFGVGLIGSKCFNAHATGTLKKQ
jgi:hypothetical protein